MDRGAWRATVHGFAKSWTRLKRLSMNTKTALGKEGEKQTQDQLCFSRLQSCWAAAFSDCMEP